MMRSEGDIDYFGYVVRHRSKKLQPPLREDRKLHLEDQVGDERGQIGVARPLSVPVDTALNLADPGVDGSQRTGHSAANVVVEVDTKLALREGGLDPTDGCQDLRRQGASVGVAKHQSFCPCIGGCLENPEGVIGVAAEARSKRCSSVKEHRAGLCHRR